MKKYTPPTLYKFKNKIEEIDRCILFSIIKLKGGINYEKISKLF
jgi:hypothetical protein